MSQNLLSAVVVIGALRVLNVSNSMDNPIGLQRVNCVMFTEAY